MAHHLAFSFVLIFQLLMSYIKAEGVPGECEDLQKAGIDECCKYPPEADPETAYRVEVFLRCRDEIVGKDSYVSTEIGLEKMECLQECVFNGSNWLTPDKKLKLDEIADALKRQMSSLATSLKEAYDISAVSCFKTEIISKVKEDAKCKSGAFQLNDCLSRHLYLNCPEEFWQKDVKACSGAKEIVSKCPPFGQ